MPTTEDMRMEMFKIYDDNSHVFEEAKIERLKFLQWLESIQDYGTLRKAHSYCIHKLLPKIQVMRSLYVLKKAEVWASMKRMMPTHPDTVRLRGAEFDVRTVWQARVRPRRLA